MRTTRCLVSAAAQLAALAVSGCSSVFYQPDAYMHAPPKAVGYSPKELKFASVDGTKLIAWFFPAAGTAPAKGTIVQFHGNAENISSHYLSLAWLTRQGYNLFTFDYRGFGGSEGEPSQEGTYLDGMAALDKAWALRTGRRFIVFGQSLGGAIAMRAFADFRHQSETQLVVLDSTFMSYQTVARRVLARHWYTWWMSPLAYVLVSDKYSSENAVRRNKTRLLIIHDKEDPSVPFADGQDINDAATAPHEFWTLDQGLHIAATAPFNIEYRKRLLTLFDSL